MGSGERGLGRRRGGCGALAVIPGCASDTLSPGFKKKYTLNDTLFMFHVRNTTCAPHMNVCSWEYIHAACMTDTTGCTDLRQQPRRDGLRGSRGPRYQVSLEGENDLNLIKVINPLARLISAYPFMRRITNGLIRKLMLMLLSPHRRRAAGPSPPRSRSSAGGKKAEERSVLMADECSFGWKRRFDSAPSFPAFLAVSSVLLL